MQYETVVGLEVHCQLLTRSKLFCGCETSFGGEPNTQVCPVCLGLPGALPVLNGRAVSLAARACAALDMTVHPVSVFARKNYFYPDLPKGYQITQFARPIGTGGRLTIYAGTEKAREIAITRIHMEEDAGKTIHAPGGDSVVDLNRAGTPLIEIVSEPELRSGAEAAAYLKALRDVVTFLGVNDGNLEEGSFRCDANVSIRPKGSETLGTRCEIKNVNSFKFTQKAIEYEARRQEVLISAGEKVVQQTRGWNERTGKTFAMRSKEDAHDYRYFPEPDLAPVRLSSDAIADIQAGVGELPIAKAARYVESYKLNQGSAEVLLGHPHLAAYFEAVVAEGAPPRKAGNFIQAEVLAHAQFRGLEASFPVEAAGLAGLLKLVDAGTISGKQAKEVFGLMRESGKAAEEIVKECNMAVQSDSGALEGWVTDVIAAFPSQLKEYKGGKTALLGFFMGQVMKRSKGSANPKLVSELLRKRLSE